MNRSRTSYVSIKRIINNKYDYIETARINWNIRRENMKLCKWTYFVIEKNVSD